MHKTQENAPKTRYFDKKLELLSETPAVRICPLTPKVNKRLDFDITPTFYVIYKNKLFVI